MALIPFFCMIGVSVIAAVCYIFLFNKDKKELNLILKTITCIAVIASAFVSAHLNGTFELPILFIILGFVLLLFKDILIVILDENIGKILYFIFGFLGFIFFAAGTFLITSFNFIPLIIAVLFMFFMLLLVYILKFKLEKINWYWLALEMLGLGLFLGFSLYFVSGIGLSASSMLLVGSAVVFACSCILGLYEQYKGNVKLGKFSFGFLIFSELLISSAIFLF